MNRENFKGLVIGVIGSLIASGIVYFFTKEWLWNYKIPVWIWLAASSVAYLGYRIIRWIIFKKRLKDILDRKSVVYLKVSCLNIKRGG